MLSQAVERFRRWNHRRTTSVFFLGFPKTGNTWTRFLLGRYAQLTSGGEMPLFDGYDRFGRCERFPGGPSVHFTHGPLVWRGQTAGDLTFRDVVEPYRSRQVVLIVRYPLDALLSHWFQLRFQQDPPYTGTFLDLLEDPVLGLSKCLRFYDLWASERAGPSVYRLRYEDLKREPAGEFGRLLRFLRVPVDPERLAEAIESCSFESMRRLEDSGNVPRYRSSGLPVFGPGGPSPGARHVRQGRVGGYRDHLDPQQATAYEQRIGAEMHEWYGYREAVTPA